MTGHAGVTNRIPFDEAADLLTGARACVAWVAEGTPHVEPAVVRAADAPERFLVGIDSRADPAAGGARAVRAVEAVEAGEAVLVIDDGVLFFDLRAIYARGTPSSRMHDAGDDAVHDAVGVPADTGRIWFELEATKVTCWDYGRLRTAEHTP